MSIEALAPAGVDEETLEGLTLPHFAAVSAYLRHFPADRRGDVLARVGLAAPRWDAAQRAWRRRIDDDIAKDDVKLALAWRDAFAAVIARLEGARAELEPAQRAAEVAPTAAPKVEKPSYQRPGADLSARVVPSYIAAAPTAPPAPSVAPVAPLDRVSPPPVVAKVSVGETIAQPSPFAQPTQRASLPFTAGNSPLRNAPPPSFAAPKPRTTAETIAQPSPFAVNAKAPLPFPAAPEEPAPVSASPAALAPRSAWTLEQYASLRVDLTMAPDAAAATLARYGMTDARQRDALDRDFARRFQEDGRQEAQFWSLVAAYTEYAKQRRQ